MFRQELIVCLFINEVEDIDIIGIFLVLFRLFFYCFVFNFWLMAFYIIYIENMWIMYLCFRRRLVSYGVSVRWGCCVDFIL